MPREWDATRYDAQPLPHLQWGIRTIERLRPVGGETILDAGCGTGRDAEQVLKLLGDGRVVAVDGSTKMLARLRERLAGNLDRVTVIHADLGEPLPVGELVDGVFSVAAFHWVPDHQALFTNLAAVMKPGARLAADCGGLGNIASVAAAVDTVDTVRGPQTSPWNFAGVEETTARLEKAGFTDLAVRLVPYPATFAGPGELNDYLRTVVLGGQLDRLPEAEHDDFVAAVAAELPEPVVDYVRLEIDAIKA